VAPSAGAATSTNNATPVSPAPRAVLLSAVTQSLRELSALVHLLLVVSIGSFVAITLIAGNSAAPPLITSPVSAQHDTLFRYYRAKNMFEERFVTLFLKTSYPVLQEQVKRGEITNLTLKTPRVQPGVQSPWTLLVSFDYPRNIGMPTSDARIEAALFGERQGFDLEKIAERELIDARWDVIASRLLPR
jgi:hypothetical protein